MPRSKAIHYYATKADLKSLIAAVESQQSLKYVRGWLSEVPDAVVLTSGLQIPNLGFAPTGDSNLEPFWLITSTNTNVTLEPIPQRRGGIRYGLIPEQHPESVFIWPGGVFEDSCVIAGRIGTGMINTTSMALLNLFTREIRRQFRRINSFYVGPEAKLLFDAGYRLTHGIRTARTSDLSRP